VQIVNIIRIKICEFSMEIAPNSKRTSLSRICSKGNWEKLTELGLEIVELEATGFCTGYVLNSLGIPARDASLELLATMKLQQKPEKRAALFGRA